MMFGASSGNFSLIRGCFLPSWRGPLPDELYDKLFQLLNLSQPKASRDIGGCVRLAWLFGVFSFRLRKARLIFLVKYSVR